MLIGLGIGVMGLLFVEFFPLTVVDRIVAYRQWRDELGTIDVSDGIQEAEADVIAARYERLLLGESSACSATTTPVLIDGRWRAEILFGFGGERTGHWITVDPISGGVASPNGRAYATLTSFRAASLVRAIVDGQ